MGRGGGPAGSARGKGVSCCKGGHGLGFGARTRSRVASWRRAIKTTYTTYSYRLSDGVNRWEIQKRFSDFDTLDRELQNRYPKRMLKIDKIPRKSKFHAMAPRHIEAREKGFDTYLRQLLRDGELLQSPELTEFLEIPREAAVRGR